MNKPPDYSNLPPPLVYRPVVEDSSIAGLHKRMGEMVGMGIVKRPFDRYRLDTLYIRETREISRLGQFAIDKFVEALELLGPKMAANWNSELSVPITGVETGPGAAGGRRLMMSIAETDELKAERELAAEILKRLTGQPVTYFPFSRKITVGKLNTVVDKQSILSRVEDVLPAGVTLLPNRIDLK